MPKCPKNDEEWEELLSEYYCRAVERGKGKWISRGQRMSKGPSKPRGPRCRICPRGGAVKWVLTRRPKEP